MYSGGTNEGNSALGYFNKWGFYATVYDLGNGNRREIKELLQTNIHELHILLSVRNDTMKLKHKIQNTK